ncbi:hypothetical protein FACS1894187_20690 [Synergistales bacterium]|nr:hypothetical protein FACS1894187_20690 [Synergistales bacterium]
MIFKRNVLFLAFLAIALRVVMTSAADAATGYAWIGGVEYDSPYDLTTDNSGAGWSWSAAGNKLAIDGAYVHNINISCNSADVINLEVNGAVTVSNGTYGSAIVSTGSLNIYGTGTLTLLPSEIGTEYSIPTIRAAQDLIISGGTVIVTAYDELNRAIVSEYGNVIIKGTANVTFTVDGNKGRGIYAYGNVKIDDSAIVTIEGTGPNSEGILTQNGDITIDSNAVVRAKRTGEGYALHARSGSIIINSNNVTLFADDEEYLSSVPIKGTGNVDTVTPENNPETTKKSGGGGGCSVVGLGVFALCAIVLLKKSVKR